MPRTPLVTLFLVFLKLGLTAFGGPVAHLGYYRREFVLRRGWLDEQGFAELVAIGQFLPGPSSSQVGIAVGAQRAGLAGAILAWVGFTLPAAALMTLFAYGVGHLDPARAGGWIAGLKIAALAVVANALLGMARSLTPDAPRAGLALAAAAVAVLLPGTAGQLGAIGLGALAGTMTTPASEPPRHAPAGGIGRRTAIVCAVLFVALLVGLPVAAAVWQAPWLTVAAGFFRAGSLVFGGGHVVLPLLESVVVPPGWVDRETFLAGYGAAQAIPGPMFAITAYLGAAMVPEPNGVAGGLLCLVALFLPGFLLVLAALPAWRAVSRIARLRGAMAGVNAAVVGLLGAALYDPVFTSAVHAAPDLVIAAAGFVALARWRAPPWAVVVVLAAGRAALGQ
ncbi:MAG TPA: chromate efflux transporter [Alphaproteobacteria bacterium]